MKRFNIAIWLAVLTAIAVWISRLVTERPEVGFVTGLVVFIMIWWLTLFTVLPFGVRGQFEDGDVAHGTEPGAPTSPKLAQKAWITTGLASVFWLIFVAMMEFGLLPSP